MNLPETYGHLSQKQKQLLAENYSHEEVYQLALKGHDKSQQWIVMKLEHGFEPYHGTKKKRLDCLLDFWNHIHHNTLLSPFHIVNSIRDILFADCYKGTRSHPDELQLGLDAIAQIQDLTQVHIHKRQFQNVHTMYLPPH
jgi:hypothetical protein